MRLLLLSIVLSAAACTGGSGEGSAGFGDEFDGDFTGGFGSGRDNRGQYGNLGEAIEDFAAIVCAHAISCGADEEFGSQQECEGFINSFCQEADCAGPAPGSREDYNNCFDAITSSCATLEGDLPSPCVGLFPEDRDGESETPPNGGGDSSGGI